MRTLILVATATTVIALATGAYNPPVVQALPGQCWNNPFGGFCDQLPEKDGSFMHCESYGFGSSKFQNCFQSCIGPAGQLMPTDYDLTTPC
jgi:hypothetical protein